MVSTSERTAFLVDEVWPEFNSYLQSTRTANDVLLLPLKGRPSYNWSAEGFGQVHEARFQTIMRSLRSRRLADQGAPRQTARLRSSREVAAAYASKLRPEVTHLVVTLDLLPFLWLDGHLGGRSFDVLMTRFPMQELQERLDQAHRSHPERALLADFRAPEDLVRLENEALAAAHHLVTPHAAIAKGDKRRILLEWERPAPIKWTPCPAIAFPGPTVARKGAYEVREASKRIGLRVRPLGSELEGPNFWENPVPATKDWLEGVCAVVQPAILEDKPRRLLRALASGCPIIATEACGIQAGPLVTIVEEGDVEAIVAALDRICHN